MSTDNWSEISTFCCKTCFVYVPKNRAGGATNLGRCRRHAPKVGDGWPVVFETDFCGDHKIDERKLTPQPTGCEPTQV